MTDRCAHCGEPAEGSIRGSLGGLAVSFCCHGCAAAAEWIEQAQLGAYYRLRTASAATPVSGQSYAWFDLPHIQRQCVATDGNGKQVEIALDGMRCPACGWLLERALGQVPGVHDVSPNLSLGRLRFGFDPERAPLSVSMEHIAQLGYQPRLPGLRADPAHQRQALKRLFVAAFGAMQVMMMAEPMYYAAFGEPMPAPTRDLFRWLSALMTLPVLLYAGSPFLRGALNEWSQRAPAMDTLVTIALWSAYLASVAVTAFGGSEVYFEAVTMFLLFLTVGRLLEERTQRRARLSIDRLAARRSERARRWVDDRYQEVDPLLLEVGDQVQVLRGEPLPGDGVLLSAQAQLDEALLTGEASAVVKRQGDQLVAGSVVLDRAVEARLTKVGAETTLARLQRAIVDAAQDRPPLAQFADRLAQHFTVAMLTLACIGAWYWLPAGPEMAITVGLAVLVAACPCALALAIPSTYTATQGALAGAGLIVQRLRLIDALATVDTVVFDKTGTLTTPGPRPVLRWQAPGVDPGLLWQWAASLQSRSNHPLARAFSQSAPTNAAVDVLEHPGLGIEATVDGRRLRIGHPSYVSPNAGDSPLPDRALGTIWLADSYQVLAVFSLDESLRPEARSTVQELREHGLQVRLLSGDSTDRVRTVAKALGLAPDHAEGMLRPDDKLARLKALRAAGRCVLMVGDGLNDGPVLATADAAIAVASSLAAVHQVADAVIVDGRLSAICALFDQAQRARAVVRQNLGWAVGYNLIAVGAALAGLLPPWAAALGMASSSLLVVANASRMLRLQPRRATPRPPLEAVAEWAP